MSKWSGRDGSDPPINDNIIIREFLSKGAKAEINIDGKTMEETRIAMKTPTRWYSGLIVDNTITIDMRMTHTDIRNTYDKAAEHVYLLLLKKDCYPRFIRSEHYKNLLANAINPGNTRKR